LPGGYVNLLDEGQQQRVPPAFGPNCERVLKLKRVYDPHDIFQSAGHIAPTVS
jgi:hypothetical protein